MPHENGEVEHEPQVRVDEDWKRRVAEQRERERQGEARPQAGAPPGDERTDERALPKPTLQTLIAGLYTQTLIALGQVKDPSSQEAERHLPEAAHVIDLLALLQEKTQGNLTDEEAAYLRDALYQLRMLYVEATREPSAGAASGGTTAEG